MEGKRTCGHNEEREHRIDSVVVVEGTKTPLTEVYSRRFPSFPLSPPLSLGRLSSRMAYSLTNFLIAFVSFNVAILTWVFRTSTDPFTTTMQLTLPLLVWEVLLFASFAPDGLLDLFLPRLHRDDNYRFVAPQPPGPHGDCWSDEPTEYNGAEDLTEMTFRDSSDSDDEFVYMRPALRA